MAMLSGGGSMDLQWKDDFEQLRAAQSEHQLFERVTGIAKRLGFDHCCYGIRVPLPASKPTVAIFDTYPSGWMKHYQEQNFIDVDPTVREGINSTGLIVWPDSPSEAPSDSRRLWADAHDHGLVVGCAYSSWAARGCYGLLSVARPADPLTSAEIDLVTPKMRWLANLSHMLMSQFLVPKLAPEANVSLTRRECEVLRWTSDGKTSFQIGQILNITERTVNFHVNRVVLKLNATNKLQAVVKAIALGLVD
jgi:LuxR family quorum-sensing system transcriptional regulator SolR